jgi:hypothetical protein
MNVRRNHETYIKGKMDKAGITAAEVEHNLNIKLTKTSWMNER